MFEYPAKITETTLQAGAPAATPQPSANQRLPAPQVQHQMMLHVQMFDDEEETTFDVGAPPPAEPFYGVLGLALVASSKTSKSFNSWRGAGAFVDESGFCFAPGIDTVEIAWALTRPDVITKATFELFCRDINGPIASKEWVGGDLDKLVEGGEDTTVLDGKCTGKIRWDANLLPIQDANNFPDGLPTAEHSPYQLRMTVEGPQGSGYPLTGWTHFHVRVHSIDLFFGDDNDLAGDRTDIVDNADYKITKANVLQYEKDALAALKANGNRPTAPDTNSPDGLKKQRVVLEGNVFEGGESKNSFEAFKALWGDGPRIPLRARLNLRRADGTAVDEGNHAEGAKALGALELFWEWQDDPHHKWQNWLGATDIERTKNSTRASRLFLEKVVDNLHQDPNTDAYPPGSNNCPVEFGGKRGTGGKPVFPVQNNAAHFPFEVRAATTRKWAAISKTGTGNELGWSGAIFQPSRMPGDKYRVVVYLAVKDTANQCPLDVLERTIPDPHKVGDTLRSSVENLPEDKRLPLTATGIFEVFRSVKLVYHVNPAAAGRTHADYAAQVYERVAGIQFDLDVQLNLPPNIKDPQRFTDALNHQFTRGSQRHYFLSNAFVLPQPAADANNFVVCRTYAEYQQRGLQLLKEGIFFVESSGATNFLKGTGLDIGGVKGWVLGTDTFQKDGNTHHGFYLMVANHNNAAIAPNTAISGADSQQGLDQYQPTGQTAVKVITRQSGRVRPMFRFACYSKKDEDRRKRDYVILPENEWDNWTGKVKVTIGQTTAARPPVDLAYERSGLRRLVKRSISQTGKDALLNSLIGALDNIPVDREDFILIIIEGQADSQRDQQRLQRVRAYFESLFDQKVILNVDHLYNQFAGDQDILLLDEESYYNKLRGDLKWIWLDLQAEYNLTDLANQKGIHYLQLERFTTMPTIQTGAYNTGKAQPDLGVAYSLAPGPAYRITKRALVSAGPLVVHEIGHALFMKHAMRMWFGEVNAPGADVNQDSHVKHDTCVMNYDADPLSIGYCGQCIVKLRGWNYEQIAPDTHLNGANDEDKLQHAINIVKHEFRNNNTLHEKAWQRARAAFLMSFQDSIVNAADEQAKRNAGQALARQSDKALADLLRSGEPEDSAMVGAMLREAVVAHAKFGDPKRAAALFDRLKAIATHKGTDLDGSPDNPRTLVSQNQNKQSVQTYRITLELDDVQTLFTQGGQGHDNLALKERLQVLGLFNRPLDHPESDNCLAFSRQHAERIIPGVTTLAGAAQTDAIKNYLIEGGTLPAAGQFAKLRIPGGWPVMSSQTAMMLRFPEEQYPRDQGYQEGEHPNEVPYSSFMIGADRYKVEDQYFQANSALGKIPLKIKIEQEKTPGQWKPIPQGQVSIELVPPDPLPAFQNPNPAADAHPLAGGQSYYNQVVAPPLGGPPQTYLTDKVDNYNSAGHLLPNDPQQNNTDVFLGGKRGLGGGGNVATSGVGQTNLFCDTRANQFQDLPSVGTPTPHTLNLIVDDNGEGRFVFCPSQVGGDAYKLRAYIAGHREDADNASTVHVTGTMVVWRSVRMSRYLRQEPPANAGEVPQYLTNNIIANCTHDLKVGMLCTQCFLRYGTLPQIDLTGHITGEFAKAYCELILEPDAQNPQSLHLEGNNIMAALRQILQIPNTNRPSQCGELDKDYFRQHNVRRDLVITPFKTSLQQDPLNPQKFFVQLFHKNLDPGYISVRPSAGGGKGATILHDMDGDGQLKPINTGDLVMGDPKYPKAGPPADVNQIMTRVNYAEGWVRVEFNTPPPANAYEVWYYCKDYLDLEKMFVFPAKSPYIFNLLLPQDYNAAKRPQYQMIRPEDLQSAAGRQHAFQYIDRGSLGPVKNLMTQACARGIGQNNGFYPGLVLIQGCSFDSYNGVWGGASTQQGKGVETAIFVTGSSGGGVSTNGVNSGTAASLSQLTVHELGHGIYMEHAPNTGAPHPGGYKRHLHDADDRCVMSYDTDDGDHCGKCTANLRGMDIRSGSFQG